MSEAILAKLNTFITGEILKQPGRQLAAGEKLISSGLIDSFNLVDLSIFVENTFGVQLDDTELNAGAFDSLAELAALILQRQA
mgnify:CR=1 FL=1